MWHKRRPRPSQLDEHAHSGYKRWLLAVSRARSWVFACFLTLSDSAAVRSSSHFFFSCNRLSAFCAARRPIVHVSCRAWRETEPTEAPCPGRHVPCPTARANREAGDTVFRYGRARAVLNTQDRERDGRPSSRRPRRALRSSTCSRLSCAIDTTSWQHIACSSRPHASYG